MKYTYCARLLLKYTYCARLLLKYTYCARLLLKCVRHYTGRRIAWRDTITGSEKYYIRNKISGVVQCRPLHVTLRQIRDPKT